MTSCANGIALHGRNASEGAMGNIYGKALKTVTTVTRSVMATIPASLIKTVNSRKVLNKNNLCAARLRVSTNVLIHRRDIAPLPCLK